MKSFLSSRPVLWFLFLFNAGVAAAAGFVLDGVQGITAAAGMGLVSLGAGFGLLQSRKTKSRGTQNRETQGLETRGRGTPTPA
nr:hypothetical protein HEP87_27080 [Streptomyces sp. S1D4-11]